MDYIIKRCEYDELLEVAHLYNELSRELKQFAKDNEAEDIPIADNTMQRILRSAIKECNLIIFVAKIQDKVIGFISGSIKKGEALVSGGNPIGYIEAAYVMHEYNREEILFQLEDKLLLEFKDRKACFSGLNTTNKKHEVMDNWMSTGYQSYRELKNSICYK